MIAIISGTIVIVLSITLVRWVMAVPVVRTLSAAIDDWADGVQGQDV